MNEDITKQFDFETIKPIWKDLIENRDENILCRLTGEIQRLVPDICTWRRLLKVLLQVRLKFHTKQCLRLWTLLDLEYFVDLCRADSLTENTHTHQFWTSMLAREYMIISIPLLWSNYVCHSASLQNHDMVDGIMTAFKADGTKFHVLRLSLELPGFLVLASGGGPLSSNALRRVAPGSLIKSSTVEIKVMCLNKALFKVNQIAIDHFLLATPSNTKSTVFTLLIDSFCSG